MSEITITFQDLKQGDTVVKMVNFQGELDETNVDHEAKKLYQVIDEMEVPNLILNFSGLNYMNSKSIGYVTDWYGKITGKGGKMVICNPKPNILDILTVVGLANIMPIHKDEAMAQQEFFGSAATTTADTPSA